MYDLFDSVKGLVEDFSRLALLITVPPALLAGLYAVGVYTRNTRAACLPACARTDLRAADLAQMELKRADLRAANLSGANLRNPSLRYAALSGAGLDRAVVE